MCSHIRKSAGRSLFAAHRSLSQLVTSFIGSQCQGILHMLFLAWTTFVYWSQYTRFSSMLELLCIILAVFYWTKCFYLFVRQNCFFTLFTEKPDFVYLLRLILFPFTFVCHVCHTNSFELIWIHLIRFSMNIRLTFVKLYSYLIFIKFLWNLTTLSLTLFLVSDGLKWTRTTDLALIRRAL